MAKSSLYHRCVLLKSFPFYLQEHKHLLKILFANELQKSQCAPFTWNGQFSKEVRSTGKSYTSRIFS